MPECPESIEGLQELEKLLPLCRVTLYEQAKAKIESGAAKSISDAARQLGDETGRNPGVIRSAINRQQASVAELQLSTIAKTDKHRPPIVALGEKEILEKAKEIQGVKREAKEEKREERRQQNRKIIEANPQSISELKAKFSTIVIDPPWDWGDEGDCDQLGRAKPTYHTMTFSEILDLPVNELSDIDCHLYLWITNRSLPKGFALLEKWGFRYVTCLTWCKPSIGMGNYFRGSTEQVLFGVKGSQPLKRKNVGTWFQAPRGKEHSSKPEEFIRIVESCSHGPYLEMFARSKRIGWTSWGGEIN